MLEDNQIYVVVDIETNGNVPGLSSMLSVGAVATTETEEAGRFYAKLLPLPEAGKDERVMAWWRTKPDAWREVTADARPAEAVMKEFDNWLEGLSKQPLFVAHPIAFDYAFVSWYFWKFLSKNPFTDSRTAPIGLDLTSFISGKFGRTFEQSRRFHLPAWMTENTPKHSHNALDDAAGYAVILRNVLHKST